MNTLGAEGTPFVVLVDFEMASPLVIRLDECIDRGVYFSFPRASNAPPPAGKQLQARLVKFPMTFEEYARAFSIVMRHIHEGNSYLVNLTFPTPITLNMSLTEVYAHSNAPFRLLLRDQCVVFSPERFVRMHQGTISTCPMKGTIDASVAGAREILLQDKKEEAEHVTVVDLLRNDLSMVSRNVRVERYRYLEQIETNEKALLQMSSQITGDLAGDFRARIGDIVLALLPAGSISGAPKHKTLDIIREAEHGPRGYYTGICGIFDGEEFDSCVMIRFIEQDGASLLFRSGGGITHASVAELEYQELLDKVYVPIV
jgi:para-aminobenzoate synthetase component I